MRFVLLILLACVATPAFAGIPCVIINTDTTGTPAVVLITPAGTAPTLAEQGVTVGVQILDCLENPIVQFPYQDIWLHGFQLQGVAMCQGGSFADANTDSEGRTTITGAISGGGFTTGGTMVFVNGDPADWSTPLPIEFVSPDLDADLDVDLADFSAFGQDFSSGAFRSDLVPDGIVDLADFSVFGQHFGETCP